MEGGNGKWGHRKGGNLKQIKYNLDKKQFYFDDETNTAVDKTGFIPCVNQSGQMCSFILQLSHSPNIINYLNNAFKLVDDNNWQPFYIKNESSSQKLFKTNPLGNEGWYVFKRTFNSIPYWCKIILDTQNSTIYCAVCAFQYMGTQIRNNLNINMIKAELKNIVIYGYVKHINVTYNRGESVDIQVDGDQYNIHFNNGILQYDFMSDFLKYSNDKQPVDKQHLHRTHTITCQELYHPCNSSDYTTGYQVYDRKNTQWRWIQEKSQKSFVRTLIEYVKEAREGDNTTLLYEVAPAPAPTPAHAPISNDKWVLSETHDEVKIYTNPKFKGWKKRVNVGGPKFGEDAYEFYVSPSGEETLNPPGRCK